MRIRSKYLEEKLTAADPTSKWISDFVHSDNPKFAGKSKKERIRMALGASYAAKGQSRNEDFVIKHKTSGQILSTHESEDSAKDEHSALSNREDYVVTRSKIPAREFSVKEQRQLHRVNVTVTDPNHPATTMRNTKIQKIVALSADDKDHAVTKAKQYYKDRGYKVHDHLYMGLKEEAEQLAELDKEPGGTLHRYLAKAGGPEGRQRRIKAAMHNPSKLKKINTGIKSAETKIEKERQKQTGMNPQYRPEPKLSARDIQKMDMRYTHEEYETVPASKALQKAHDDERRKRGLPDPDYYLKLAAQKKKEIEDMKRNEETTGPGASKKAENKFHNKLDKLVHKTFGHSPDEKKKNEEVELEEAQYGVNLGSRPASIPFDKVKVVKTFLATKEKEAREFAKQHGHRVVKHKYPEGHTNKYPHEFQVVKEEVEQIDELKKSTLASYAKKASHDARIKMATGKDFERHAITSRKSEYKAGAKEWEDKYKSAARKREAGVYKAIDRLAKEEVEQVDELKKSTLGSYVSKASVDMANRTAEGERKRTLAGADYAHNISRGMSVKTAEAGMKKDYAAAKPDVNKAVKRMRGIDKAVGRLAKEEVELDEISQNTALNAYAQRAVRASTTKDPKDQEKADKSIARIGKRWTADAQRRAWNRADKLIYKEEVELDESGGPVVWKKGKDHIEKYGDDKFALYVNGIKTKYYKTMDAAKSALKEQTAIIEAGRMQGGGKDPCWKGYKMIGTKNKAGREVPNCVPVKEEKTFKSLREELNGN